jgi:uncharacterized protein YjbJ (UPF0337 family)
VKGVKLQAEGSIQKGFGDAKKAVKDSRDAQHDALKTRS